MTIPSLFTAFRMLVDKRLYWDLTFKLSYKSSVIFISIACNAIKTNAALFLGLVRAPQCEIITVEMINTFFFV